MKPRWLYLTTTLSIVLFIVSAAFAWKYYQEARFWQETYETETQQAWDLYNQAKVRLVKKIEEVKFLDKKLQEELGRTKIKTVKEVVRVYVKTPSREVTGQITEVRSATGEVLPGSFEYQDFRLHAQIDVRRRTMRYSLLQRWGINLYVLPHNDYRVEIAELGPNNEVIGVYSPTTFTVTRVVPERSQRWHLGVSLSVGGGFYLDVEPSPYVLLNFASYGDTKLDSTWRVASVGVSRHGLEFAPVSYRISDHLPFLSDLYIEPLIGTDWRFSRYRVGLGVSSTF